jgi:hypothetical protein
MRPKGGWKSVANVEIAVAEYVDWFNHRRLHGEIGLIPPPSSRPTTGHGRPPSLTVPPASPSGSEASELSLYRIRGDPTGERPLPIGRGCWVHRRLRLQSQRALP